MASDWVTCRLGDVIELKRGYDLPQSQRRDGQVPIVSSAGISGTHCEAMVKAPGVVTGRYGTIGEVFFLAEDFWPLNTTLYVRDFKGSDPKFISYFLKGLDFSAYSDKAAVPGLNRNHLHEAIVRVPSDINEQRAIARILGVLDGKLELNRRRNETLEKVGRALFKDWFVDFGPVRAKLEGRAPYLASELWSLFPDSFDKQGAPGWRKSTIGDEVNVVGGGTPSTAEPLFWEHGTHHWVTPKDLATLASPVLLTTSRKITDAGVAKISSGVLPEGTVLLSSRAPIGYLAITEIPTAINQGFIAMTCDQQLPNLFVLFWCQENMDTIIGNANGSTFQEISKKNFRPIPVIVPPKEILDAFMRSVVPLYAQIVSNLRENAILAHLRDTLLPKLLSGELRIRDAERFISETAV